MASVSTLGLTLVVFFAQLFGADAIRPDNPDEHLHASRPVGPHGPHSSSAIGYVDSIEETPGSLAGTMMALRWASLAVVCLSFLVLYLRTKGEDNKVRRMDTNYDPMQEVEIALEHCGIGWYQWKILFASWLGWMADGSADEVAGFLAAVFPSVGWHVSDEDWANLRELCSVAMAGSAMGSGPIADGFGRQPVFVASCLIIACGSLASALSPNFLSFAAFRVVTSLGTGALLGTDIALYSEFLPASRRAAYLILLHIGFTSGGLFARLAAWVCLQHLDSWRTFVALCALPALAGLAVRSQLRESPFALLKQGFISETNKVLAEIASANGTSPPPKVRMLPRSSLDVVASETIRTTAQPAAAQEEASQQEKSPAKIVGICVITFSMQMGTGLDFFAPSIARHYELLNDYFYLTCSICATLAAATYILGFWLLGRGVAAWDLFIAACLACHLHLMAMSMIFQVSPHNWALAAVLVICGGPASAAAWGTLYCLFIEIFPASFRATGIGLADAGSRIASILHPKAVSLMLPSLGCAMTAQLTSLGWLVAFFLSVWMRELPSLTGFAKASAQRSAQTCS